MKLLPDDPKLTAYALGEIDDEQERKTIQQAIQQDPALQAEVENIRSFSQLLNDELKSEISPELSEFEKAQLHQEPNPVPQNATRRKRLAWPVITGIAALCAVMFYLNTSQVEQAYYEMAFRDSEADEIQEEIHHRMLEVEIPAEVIEGTPQPIKVPGLEPEATQAPRLIVAESKAYKAERVAEVGRDQPAPSAPASNTSQTPVLAKGKISGIPPTEAAGVDQLEVTDAAVDLADMEDSFALSAGLGGVNNSQALVRSRGSLGPAEPAPVACFMPPRPAEPTPRTEWNTEKYDPIDESDFRSPLVAPLSTFSIDVDTASYANVRRFLNQGQLPPADAVRIEELINYFPYNDAAPTESLKEGGDPFAVHMAQTTAPWNDQHHLLRIALKGYEMPWEERPASNLVFLLDVSGSMNSQNKLPLVKDAMNMLVQRLDQRDRVAIVVYAGASGLALPSTTANNGKTIEHAINQLESGGSTNAGEGIALAYKVARENFIEGGNNRVILCTDGDFNVGQTNRGDLAKIAEAQAEQGTSLTILGFGMGNYKDNMLETLSNKGKGSYAYVDSRKEARKVFLEDLTSNLFKIAKDVKIQVEFNPAQVSAYRLIGYENRRLKAEDFNNDQKKAGDIGPGHSIVALYELIPSDVSIALPEVDALRYQQHAKPEQLDSEVATVKLRYKQPDETVSQLIQKAVHTTELTEIDAANDDFRFSAAVAAFGLRLRESESIGDYNYAEIDRLAASALAKDSGGHRSEFLELVHQAKQLSQ